MHAHPCQPDLALHTPLRASDHFQRHTDRVHLTAEEWHILTLVLQGRNVGQIATIMSYSIGEALDKVDRLIALGLVTAALDQRPADLDAALGESAAAQDQRRSALGLTSLKRAIRRRLTH